MDDKKFLGVWTRTRKVNSQEACKMWIKKILHNYEDPGTQLLKEYR